MYPFFAKERVTFPNYLDLVFKLVKKYRIKINFNIIFHDVVRDNKLELVLINRGEFFLNTIKYTKMYKTF